MTSMPPLFPGLEPEKDKPAFPVDDTQAWGSAITVPDLNVDEALAKARERERRLPVWEFHRPGFKGPHKALQELFSEYSPEDLVEVVAGGKEKTFLQALHLYQDPDKAYLAAFGREGTAKEKAKLYAELTGIPEHEIARHLKDFEEKVLFGKIPDVKKAYDEFLSRSAFAEQKRNEKEIAEIADSLRREFEKGSNQEALIYKYARMLEVSPAYVRANLDKVRAEVFTKKVLEDLDRLFPYPKDGDLMKAWLKNPENASLAVNSLPYISRVRGMMIAKKASWPEKFWKSQVVPMAEGLFGAGILSFSGMLNKGASFLLSPISEKAKEDQYSLYLQAMATSKLIEESQPVFAKGEIGYGTELAGAFGQMIAAVSVTLLSGGSDVPVLFLYGTSEAGNLFREKDAQGVPFLPAFLVSVSVGTLNAAIESMQIKGAGRIGGFRKFLAKDLVRQHAFEIAGEIMREGAEELIQQVVHEVGSIGLDLAGPARNRPSFKQILQRIGGAVTSGLYQGSLAALSASFFGAFRLRNLFHRVSLAQAQQEFVKNIMEASQAAPMTEENVEATRTFLQAAFKGSDLERSYIPAPAVEEYFQDKGEEMRREFLEALAITEEKFLKVLREGGDLEFNTEDWLARAARMDSAVDLFSKVSWGGQMTLMEMNEVAVKAKHDAQVLASTLYDMAEVENPGELSSAKLEAMEETLTEFYGKEQAKAVMALFKAGALRFGKLQGMSSKEIAQKLTPTIVVQSFDSFVEAKNGKVDVALEDAHRKIMEKRAVSWLSPRARRAKMPPAFLNKEGMALPAYRETGGIWRIHRTPVTGEEMAILRARKTLDVNAETQEAEDFRSWARDQVGSVYKAIQAFSSEEQGSKVIRDRVRAWAKARGIDIIYDGTEVVPMTRQAIQPIKIGPEEKERFQHPEPNYFYKTLGEIDPENIEVDKEAEEEFFQQDPRKWRYDFSKYEWKVVNNRVAKEFEIIDALGFKPPSLLEELIVTGEPGKKSEKRNRVPEAYSLAEAIYAQLDWAKKLFDPNLTPEELFEQTDLKGAKAKAKFKKFVLKLRQGSTLFDEPPEKGVLSANDKATAGVSLALFMCQPSASCPECYVAKAMIRFDTVFKAVRNSLLILLDPKAFGQAVAEEAKAFSKLDFPYIRLLDSGDMTFSETVEAFNEIAKHADRDIHIFSRHHDNLAKLKSTWNSAFMKMGSLDIGLYEHYVKKYGKERLKNNLRERGISNCWLLRDPSEIPLVNQLVDEGIINLIFPASEKLHPKLGVLARASSCPCDIHEKSSIGACRGCAASAMGCRLAFNKVYVDEAGNLLVEEDLDKAQGNVRPLATSFLNKAVLEEGLSGRAEAVAKTYANVVRDYLKKMQEKTRDDERAWRKMRKVILEEKRAPKQSDKAKMGVKFRDYRAPDQDVTYHDIEVAMARENMTRAKRGKPPITLEEMRQKEAKIQKRKPGFRYATKEEIEARLQAYRENLQGAWAKLEKGTFFIPGGEAVPPVAYKAWKKMDTIEDLDLNEFFQEEGPAFSWGYNYPYNEEGTQEFVIAYREQIQDSPAVKRTLEDENFKKWFEGSKIVDQDGKPLVVFHRTLRDIEGGAFDISKIPLTNDVGRAFYFSDSALDSAFNYASMEGPDLRFRINRILDRIDGSYIEEVLNEGDEEAYAQAQSAFGGLIDDMSIEEFQDYFGDNEDYKDVAEELIRERMKLQAPRVIPVFLSIKNPAYVDSIPPEQREKLGIEVKKSVIGDFDEGGDEFVDQLFDYLTTAIDSVVTRENIEFSYNQIEEAVSNIVMPLMERGGELTTAALTEKIQEVLGDINWFYMAGPTADEYAVGEVIKEVLELYGFDGVVHLSAGPDFRMKGQIYETAHYIAFYPEQIKSVYNTGTWSTTDARILFQEGSPLNRGRKKGAIQFGKTETIIRLFEGADLSTIVHEMGHLFLRQLQVLAHQGHEEAVQDIATLEEAFGSLTRRESVERVADAWTRYIAEGRAPTPRLAGVFARLSRWLLDLFRGLRNLIKGDRMDPEVKAVFDRWLASEQDIQAARAYYERNQALSEILATGASRGQAEPPGAGQAKSEGEGEGQKTQEPERPAEDESEARRGRRRQPPTERETRAARNLKEARARLEAARQRALENLVQKRLRRVVQLKGGRGALSEHIKTQLLEEDPVYSLLAEVRRLGGLTPTQFAGLGGLPQDWMEVLQKRHGKALVSRTKKVKVTLAQFEEMAQARGFASVQAALKEVLARPPLKQAVKEKVEQTLRDLEASIRDDLEKNGSLMLGDEAVHTPEDLDFILADLELLREWAARQAVRILSKAEALAFRDAARDTLRAEAPLRKAMRYDLWGKREAAAAVQAERALREGKWEKAEEAIKRRIFFFSLVQEAIRLRKDADRILKKYGLQDLEKTLKKVPPETAALVQDVAAYFGLNKGRGPISDLKFRWYEWDEARTRREFQEGLDMYLPDLKSMVPGWILEGERPEEFKDAKDLTFDQLDQLDSLLQKIIADGKGEVRALQDLGYKTITEFLTDSMRRLQTIPKKKRRDIRTIPGMIGRQINRALAALHIKEFIFEEADGSPLLRGQKLGPLHKLFNKVNQADAEEQNRLGELFHVLAPVMKVLEQESRKFDKFFDIEGVPVPRILQEVYGKTQWDFDMLIAVLLNTGNEDNLRVLAQSEYELTADKIEILRGQISKEAWQAIQTIWDVVDSLFPELESIRRRLTGLKTEKVKPLPFEVVPRGAKESIKLRGGYYPLIADPGVSERAASTEEEETFLTRARKEMIYHPTVKAKQGFTVSRIRDEEGRALSTRAPLLSTSVLFTHLKDVIHFITHAEVLDAFDKVTRDKSWAQLFKSKFGDEEYESLRTWLNYVARPERRVTDPFNKIMEWGRRNFVAAALGFRLTVGLKQRLSMFNAINALNQVVKGSGWKYIARGMALVAATKYGPLEYVGRDIFLTNLVGKGSQQLLDWIHSLSPLMKSRWYTLDRDLADALSSLKPKDLKGEKLKKLREAAFWWVKANDAAAVIPVWLAAFEQALDHHLNGITPGMEQEEAFRRAAEHADVIIRTSQPSALPSDLAPIQRLEGMARLFTTFMTWRIKAGNREMWFLSEARLKRIKAGEPALDEWISDPAATWGTLVRHFAMEWILPATVALGTSWLWYRDDRDKPGWWSWILRPTTDATLGWIPIVSEAAKAVERKEAAGVPVLAGAEALGKAADYTAKAIETGDPGRATKAAVTWWRTMEWFAGIPVSNIPRDVLRLWEKGVLNAK